jgi:uncharacterized beta-barrel protein YwiB (DUF1934 family)
LCFLYACHNKYLLYIHIALTGLIVVNVAEFLCCVVREGSLNMLQVHFSLERDNATFYLDLVYLRICIYKTQLLYFATAL